MAVIVETCVDGPIGGGTRREECEARARRDDDAQSETVVLSTRWDIRDLRTPASRSHARSRGGGEAGDRRGARGRDRDDDDDDAFADVAVYVRDARSRASPHITTAELRTPPRLSPTDPRPPRRETLLIPSPSLLALVLSVALLDLAERGLARGGADLRLLRALLRDQLRTLGGGREGDRQGAAAARGRRRKISSLSSRRERPVPFARRGKKNPRA